MIEFKNIFNDEPVPIYEDLCFKWRCENYKSFLSKAKPTVEGHQSFLWDYLFLSDSNFLYIIIHNDEPVGTIGYSVINEKKVEIQWVLLGEKLLEGTGFMSRVLTIFINMIQYPNKEVILKVLKENERAIAFYKKNKFTIEEEFENYYLMKLNDSST